MELTEQIAGVLLCATFLAAMLDVFFCRKEHFVLALIILFCLGTAAFLEFYAGMGIRWLFAAALSFAVFVLLLIALVKRKKSVKR